MINFGYTFVSPAVMATTMPPYAIYINKVYAVPLPLALAPTVAASPSDGVASPPTRAEIRKMHIIVTPSVNFLAESIAQFKFFI